MSICGDYFSPVRSCVELAARYLNKDLRALPRVNLDRLRAEGFRIEVAPPATYADMRGSRRNGGRPKNPADNAVVEEIVKAYGWWPPFGTLRAMAAKHCVSFKSLEGCFYNRRWKLGIKPPTEAKS